MDHQQTREEPLPLSSEEAEEEEEVVEEARRPSVIPPRLSNVYGAPIWVPQVVAPPMEPLRPIKPMKPIDEETYGELSRQIFQAVKGGAISRVEEEEEEELPEPIPPPPIMPNRILYQRVCPYGLAGMCVGCPRLPCPELALVVLKSIMDKISNR